MRAHVLYDYGDDITHPIELILYCKLGSRFLLALITCLCIVAHEGNVASH